MMKRIATLILLSTPAVAVSPKVASAAAVTTIAVNAVTLDKTAKASWRAMKATKRMTTKAARKVAGK